MIYLTFAEETDFLKLIFIKKNAVYTPNFINMTACK